METKVCGARTVHELESELVRLQELKENGIAPGMHTEKRDMTIDVVIGTLQWVLKNPTKLAWSAVIERIDENTRRVSFIF